MIIKKTIEVGVDIYNPIGVYADSEGLKQIISEKYEGRCFRGCLVLSVDRIIKTGDCVISQDGEPEYGTVPVMIEVTAVVYAAGEILNGCVVQNKDTRGILICSTKHASVMISAQGNYESIAVGQFISVRVTGTRYTLGASKISVSAVPYAHSAAVPVFKLGTVTAADLESCSAVLERIAAEEARTDRASTAWKTFNTLLYAYSAEQKPPPGAKPANLLELVRARTTTMPAYVCRDPRIDFSTPVVYGFSEQTFPETYQIREVHSASVVLVSMLEHYCEHLRTLREFIETYNTEEIILSHRNLWQIYKKAKLG